MIEALSPIIGLSSIGSYLSYIIYMKYNKILTYWHIDKGSKNPTYWIIDKRYDKNLMIMKKILINRTGFSEEKHNKTEIFLRKKKLMKRPTYT